MKKHWINNNNNSNLILFFNGWGMDAAIIEALDCTGYDILMLNDYAEIDSLGETFNKYTDVYVVAWSLGVWVASQVLSMSFVKVTKSIAINGTTKPVDDNEGIPSYIFRGTLDGWSDYVRKRFLMRISGGAKVYLKDPDRFGARSIENQKQELLSIFHQYKALKNSKSLINKSEAKGFYFDMALIGKQDAIFTLKNQLNSWQNKVQCKIYDMPHDPFLSIRSWHQIISDCL